MGAPKIDSRDRVFQIQQKLRIKEKEYNDLKAKCNTLESLLSNYEYKYNGIFKFLDECLQMFYEDEDIKKQKILNIDMNTLKKGNFSSLSNQEKYSVLIILMRYLMPLIYKFQIKDNNNKENPTMYNNYSKNRLYKFYNIGKINLKKSIIKNILNYNDSKFTSPSKNHKLSFGEISKTKNKLTLINLKSISFNK